MLATPPCSKNILILLLRQASSKVCFVLIEEQRELARQQLKLLLKAGYSPLRFYVHDIKKYYYLGELLSVVDLSLVSSQGHHADEWNGILQ